MACGAMQLAGDSAWIEPRRSRNFLFPVHALSKVFRAKFMHALQQAGDTGVLARDPADTALARAQRAQALHRHDWVVYAKTPSPLTHADVEARRDRRRKLCVPCAALSQTLAGIGVWCSQPTVQPRALLRGRGTTPQHSNPLDGHHLAAGAACAPPHNTL